MRSDCLLPAELTDATGTEGFAITVAGLQGGHSGADIHLGRGSANRLMGRVLAAALEKFPGLRLAAISGGQFDNVICSRCDAVAALPERQRLAVACHYLGGLPHAETAKLTGSTPAAVRRAAADGIAALRRRFASVEGTLP